MPHSNAVPTGNQRQLAKSIRGVYPGKAGLFFLEDPASGGRDTGAQTRQFPGSFSEWKSEEIRDRDSVRRGRSANFDLLFLTLRG
jgi:hypothetical protein